jgi:hypothetical protein
VSVMGERIPEGVDVRLPSPARVYDWLLGGSHNFDADRAVGEMVIAGRQVAASNRAFLRRAVRYMITQGITQFLDLGSGIPTVGNCGSRLPTAGNTHQIAQRVDPDTQVVYVDNDPTCPQDGRTVPSHGPERFGSRPNSSRSPKRSRHSRACTRARSSVVRCCGPNEPSCRFPAIKPLCRA